MRREKLQQPLLRNSDRSRQQLLVLQQESFQEEPHKHFAGLADFLRLPPRAAALDLPHYNTHEGLSTPLCSTVEKLAAFYRPYNEMLLRDLAADQISAAAPKQESSFAPWPDNLNCIGKGSHESKARGV